MKTFIIWDNHLRGFLIDSTTATLDLTRAKMFDNKLEAIAFACAAMLLDYAVLGIA